MTADPCRILVVDDEMSVRITTVLLLSQAGFEADSADDGQQAFEHVAEFNPALVLMDVKMPGLDGLEVCRRLHANPTTRHIPVVMMTAVADRDTVMAAVRAGAADYLAKPFNSNPLVRKIRAVLDPKKPSTQAPIDDASEFADGDGHRRPRGSGLAARVAQGDRREPEGGS